MNLLRRVDHAFDMTKSEGFEAEADFSASRTTERQLAISLRRIASQIGHLVMGTHDGTLDSAFRLAGMLAQYAETIGPWAVASIQRMHAEVAARDRKQWRIASARIGKELRREIETAPTGTVMRHLLAEQVGLIKSIPLEAANRVHELTVQNIIGGQRSGNMLDEIMRQGDVSRSKATLIARTETARTASLLTQVRAEHVGSPGYTWRSVMDSRTRPSHRRLNKTFHKWDEPPECDPGVKAHAGQVFNCRCWAQPVLPD